MKRLSRQGHDAAVARTFGGTFLSAVLVLCTTASPTVGHAAEPVTGLRSLAMGNTLRGIATGAEGLLLNPAGIALVPQYAVTGFYGFNVQSLGHAVHVSVADSVTQRRVAMGLYYSFVRETPKIGLRIRDEKVAGREIYLGDQSMTRNAHEVGLVTAIPLGERFSLGVTTKYGYFSTNTQLDRVQIPTDFVNASLDKDNVYDMGSIGNVVSFDVGLALRLQPVSIGLAAQNLWPHGAEQPSLLGIGVAYSSGQRLVIAGDVLLNFNGYQNCTAEPPAHPCDQLQNRTTVRTGAGLEYTIADRVPIRAGYLYDSGQNGHHVSAGLGFAATRYAIDLSMRQRVSAGPETILVLGFRIFDFRQN